MEIEKLLNKTINLPTHFLEPVTVEHITRAQVDGYYKLRVRKADGYLEEVTVPDEEIEMQRISDPAYKLAYAAKEIRSISHYDINGKEIMRMENSG